MKTKTVSGHYGTIYSVAHNNRDFLPQNVNPNRLHNNAYCVAVGHEAFINLDDPRNIHEFWSRYRMLGDLYWSQRSIMQTLEYEKYQENLRYMRKLSWLIYPIPHNPLEAFITLLLLPLLIPCGIILTHQQKQIRDEWEVYKREQWLRDMSYKATRLSLRDALYAQDYKNGTKYLHSLDAIVSDMTDRANNHIQPPPICDAHTTTAPLRFATLEEIYNKVFEPSFQEYQQKLRPCRRYNGTYLEQIREGKQKEAHRKQQTSNARSRTQSEALEIVFCIGDQDNTGYEAAGLDAKKAEELLKDFANHLMCLPNLCFITTKELQDPTWQPPFNNGLLVLNLAVHGDEATPGAHFTFIPYSRNCKRGPKVQSSLGRAMTGMGYPSTWRDCLDQNGERIPKKNRNGEIVYNEDGSIRYRQEPDKQGIIDWIEEQKQWIQKEMMIRYGWHREYKGSHPRGNLSTPDYQVARARERMEEIQNRFENELHGYEQRITNTTDKLYEAVDTVLETPSNYDYLVRYLSVCPEEEYEELLQKANLYFKDIACKEESQIVKTLNTIIGEASSKTMPSNGNTTPDKYK